MALSQSANELREFVIQYLRDLVAEDRAGHQLDFPDYELTPHNYLDFAEIELVSNSPQNRINCVSHIKRAMDCQLDTFIHVLNLSSLFAKRNLKVEKKLELIREMGVYNSRSLAKLNTIRNKTEHKYEVPDNEDLELYFELVYAFVHALEGIMFLLRTHSHNILYDFDEEHKIRGRSEIGYNYKGPAVFTSWDHDGKKQRLLFETANIEDFAFAAKVFFLIAKVNELVTSDYVISKLTINRAPSVAKNGA